MAQPNGEHAPELMYVGIRAEGIPIVEREMQQAGVDFAPFLGEDGLVQRARGAISKIDGEWTTVAAEISAGIDEINGQVEGLNAQAFRVVTVRPILPNPYFEGRYVSADKFENDHGRSRYNFLGRDALRELVLTGNRKRYGKTLSQLAIGVRLTEPVAARTRDAYAGYTGHYLRTSEEWWT